MLHENTNGRIGLRGLYDHTDRPLGVTTLRFNHYSHL